jgi:hypothetical protein
MPYLVGRDDEIHYWAPLRRKEIRPMIGMNWDAFLFCFSLNWSRYLLSVTTPWFCVQISSGALDYGRFYGLSERWYGIRLYWHHVKNWQVDEEGGLLFRKGDTSLSFVRYPKQITHEDYVTYGR